MKLLHSNTVREVMRAVSDSVMITLEIGGWHLGQPDNSEDFAEWMTPDNHLGRDILALAINYFSARHPHANRRDIASASTLVQYFCTGAYGGFGTENYEKERYVERVCLRCVGVTGDGNPLYFAPQVLLDAEPSEQQTLFILRLMDALYFSAKSEDENQKIIREVVDLLAQTRQSFKSKQIERARELLESLLE